MREFPFWFETAVKQVAIQNGRSNCFARFGEGFLCEKGTAVYIIRRKLLYSVSLGDIAEITERSFPICLLIYQRCFTDLRKSSI